MPEVVLAMLVIFDILPLEVAAATAMSVALAWCAPFGRNGMSECRYVPAAFFSNAGYEIHPMSAMQLWE